jgi:hypothetical protein
VPKRSTPGTVVLLGAASLLFAPAAEARLIAVISQQGAQDPARIGQYDVRVLDPLDPNAPATDPDLRLQDSINTVSSETQVSLTADGRFLAFLRRHPFSDDSGVSGLPENGRFITNRRGEVNSPVATKPVAMEDRLAGRVTLSPDGTRLVRHAPTTFPPLQIFSVDLTARPIPAIGIGTITTPISEPQNFTPPGQPAFEFKGNRIAWTIVKSGTGGEQVAVGTLGGTATLTPVPPREGGRFVRVRDVAFFPCCTNRSNLPLITFNSNKVSESVTGEVFVNEDRKDLGQVRLGDTPSRLERLDFSFEPALPGIREGQESMPKVSPDGRYLVWIEGAPPSSQRLRVFDRSTQDYVNAGVPLGARPIDSWALAQTNAPVIKEFEVAPLLTAAAGTAPLVATLDRPTSVGILVQRITGTRRLLGERVPRLARVGRVPLGRQHRGQVRIRWNRRVNGRRLSPGRYQITLRALRGTRVIELSTPRVVRVR